MTKVIVKKNQSALYKASQLKRESALSRAMEALEEMKNQNLPINFQSVARFAKVSKVWLYQQTELCSQIKKNRDQAPTVKRTKEVHLLVKAKEEEIKKLKLKLKEKNDKIQELKYQLEIVYGELHKQQGNY